MTNDERQDERMVGWLLEGPWDAPESLTESAVAYARAHPRRTPRLAGLRRFLMTGINLTPVPMRPGAHRSAYLALTAMAGMVLVVVAIAAGAGMIGRSGDGPAAGGAVGSPSPSQTSSVTPSPSAQPAIESCKTLNPGSERTVGSVVQTRGVAIECAITWPDERLNGTATFVYNSDGTEADGFDTWGTVRLVAEDGTWQGFWSGTAGPFGYFKVNRLHAVLLGRDAYEGFRVRWEMDNVRGGTVWDVDAYVSSAWDLSGTIETVDTVAPAGTLLVSGSSSCVDVTQGTETVSDGVTQRRGWVIECSGNVGADPRLDGVVRNLTNGDLAADESARLWGSEEITVDGALRWRGDWEGTVAAGYTTHRMAGTDVGYGPYAGLVYEWTTIGDPESGYVTTGTIKPAQ